MRLPALPSVDIQNALSAKKILQETLLWLGKFLHRERMWNGPCCWVHLSYFETPSLTSLMNLGWDPGRFRHGPIWEVACGNLDPPENDSEKVLCLTWIRKLLFLDISASVVFFNFAVTWRLSSPMSAVLIPYYGLGLFCLFYFLMHNSKGIIGTWVVFHWLNWLLAYHWGLPQYLRGQRICL